MCQFCCFYVGLWGLSIRLETIFSKATLSVEPFTESVKPSTPYNRSLKSLMSSNMLVRTSKLLVRPFRNLDFRFHKTIILIKLMNQNEYYIQCVRVNYSNMKSLASYRAGANVLQQIMVIVILHFGIAVIVHAMMPLSVHAGERCYYGVNDC